MTVDSTDRYNNNISGLRKSQPDVADLVDAALIPETIKPATGRDGSQSFLIADETGKKHWLGYSSTPTISAAEIFSGFRYEGGNIALPGFQTGVEPIVLLSHLPKHAALFVMEKNPAHIKLVFQLYDYSQLLTSGRLVVILQNQFESNIQAFFRSHPGYEFPRRMALVPQCPPVTFAQCQHQLETGGQKVMAIHSECMQESLQHLRHRHPEFTSSLPQVAIISSDISLQTSKFADRLCRSLDRDGWKYQSSIPDQPDRCHLAARLQTIEQASADWVLSIQAGAESLRPLLPDDLPVAAWMLPDTMVSTSSALELASQEVVLITSSNQYDILSDAGIPSSQLIRCEVAADDTVFFTASTRDEREPPRKFDVAMVMNLPDDEARACGIQLNSHIQLWNAMRELIAGEVDQYQADYAADIFQRAQQRSGTTVDDPKISDHFLMLLRQQLAPSVIAKTTADTLVRAGYQVGTWGQGWSKNQTSAWITGGDIPADQDLNHLFHTVKVLVVTDHTLSSLQLALDAMCAGVHVIYRATESSWQDQYPDLSSVLAYIHAYRTTDELTRLTQRLISTHEHQDQLTLAREAILKEHTVSHRLHMIVNRLRDGKKSMTKNSSSTKQVERV